MGLGAGEPCLRFRYWPREHSCCSSGSGPTLSQSCLPLPLPGRDGSCSGSSMGRPQGDGSRESVVGRCYAVAGEQLQLHLWPQPRPGLELLPARARANPKHQIWQSFGVLQHRKSCLKYVLEQRTQYNTMADFSHLSLV